MNFIGLAERDRFELSGAALEEWLKNPSGGAEVLLRHLGGSVSKGEAEAEEEASAAGARGAVDGAEVATAGGGGRREESASSQIPLFAKRPVLPASLAEAARGDGGSHGLLLGGLTIRRMEGEVFDAEVDCLVAGLGFEERALESVRRLCLATTPTRALAVRYEEVGRSVEIGAVLDATVKEWKEIEYGNVISGGLPEIKGNVVVDISGLAKPAIFHAIRNELLRKGRVWVFHTEAEHYYPLDGDLDGVLKAEGARNMHRLLEELQEILTGEEGPYRADQLLPVESDVTRQRVLCAFASSKHERLLSLLDEREFDRLEIVAPQSDFPRNRIAQLVAEVAARSNVNSNVTRIDPGDLVRLLAFIAERYKLWYIDQGSDFEIGLTGSKLQAVACAAASSVLKVSQCWYLRPERFDPERFTKGVGRTSVFEIGLEAV